MLTDQVRATFRDAASKLTGAKKRAFTAQVALDYFEGSARKTERALGWDRVSIQRGLDSLESGIPYADNYSARGRKKTEVLLSHLEQDIRDLVEGEAQADPKFQTTFRYLKVSAREVCDQLILQKSYIDEELPTRQTIGEILNRLNYRLRKP